MSEKEFCTNCGKGVNYTVKENPVTMEVEGKAINYTEEVASCSECNNPIYIGNLHDSNLCKFNKACKEAGVWDGQISEVHYLK